MSDQVNEVVDKEFPRWYYGPDGQSKIFERGEEVPEGWEDHPSKVKEPKVGDGGQKSKSEAKRVAEQGKKTPKAKEEAKVVEGKISDEAASDDNSRGSSEPEAAKVGEPEAPLTKEQIYESLLLKEMPELWGIAKELGIDHKGKKPELANRIAENFYAAQEVNEAEKPL